MYLNYILLFLSILPSIILGTYIYRKDLVEKEPKGLLVKLFLTGILATITTIIITCLLEIIVPFFGLNEESMEGFTLFIYVLFKIGLIEEFSKWIYLYGLTWKNREFNYLYDAIVYAVFVSLGFATIENILYVFSSTEAGGIGLGMFTAFGRMILSVPGHAFFGVIMGYYLGLSKLSNIHKDYDKNNKYLLCSIFVPAIIHGVFDYLLMDDYFIAYIVVVVLLYIVALSKVKRISKITISLFGNDYHAYGKFGIKSNENITNTIENKNINIESNNIQFCPYCKSRLYGIYCSNCGKKIE